MKSLLLDNLKESRQRLTDHYLAKGSFSTWEGEGDNCEPVAYCLVGALGVTDTYIPALDLLANVAQVLFPQRCKTSGAPLLYRFNDNELTTKDDVLSVYDRAIKFLEEGK